VRGGEGLSDTAARHRDSKSAAIHVDVFWEPSKLFEGRVFRAKFLAAQKCNNTSKRHFLKRADLGWERRHTESLRTIIAECGGPKTSDNPANGSANDSKSLPTDQQMTQKLLSKTDRVDNNHFFRVWHQSWRGDLR